MSVFSNRLRNRVAQTAYRPSAPKKAGDTAKPKRKPLLSAIEDFFLEDERPPEKDEAKPKYEPA